MKTRTDFVTNSSSSSFIISKEDLDKEQIKAIHKHSYLGKALGLACYDDAWTIEENDRFISGYTYLDNFDFDEFLKAIDVDCSLVSWGEFPFSLEDTVTVKKEEEPAFKNKKDWRGLLESL